MTSRNTVLSVAAGALATVFLFGCSSSSKVKLEEPKAFDQNLNSGTSEKGEKIGVRGDSIVVQKRVYLEEEMDKLKSDIRDLENNIYGDSVREPGGFFAQLQECRSKLADPRLGGKGVSEPMELWEKPSQTSPDFDYRVDAKKNVVAVIEEELGQRIVSMKKTKRILEQRYQDFEKKAASCEQRYKTALVQHGLNPEDTQAVGEWVEGRDGHRVWKMRQPKTSDPEELMRRKFEREKGRKPKSESTEGEG